MSELTWEEPPGTGAWAAGIRGKHAQVAAQLKEHPGQWAKIPVTGGPVTARNMAYQIRKGEMAAYKPPGAFEAVSRTVDGQTCLYARYVGGVGGE